MKKLISIGVVLALLTVAVVPGAVAAADPDPDLCASNYTEPCTYAKTPFAIIASGFVMLANLWPTLNTEMEMDMPWLTPIFEELAYWTYGPLSWTVDMLAWGVNLAGSVVSGIPMIADALPEGLDLKQLFTDIACGLRECFSDVCYNVTWNCTGNTTACCP